ncbi:MAG: hypothetical protein ACI9XJ_001837 [Marivirga sp.]|jgi:hypothetical protein
MLKSTLAIVFVFFIQNLLFAQSIPAKIAFSSSQHDFGNIDEADGSVKHTFKIYNISSDTLFLQSVRASCGCTTPFWSKEGILPGDTGRIVVAYNPLNRPGKFDKSVTVISSLPPTAKILKIKGYVNPKNLSLEENYPSEIGAIRFKSKFLNFGTITTKEAVTKAFDIFNQSTDTVSFLDHSVHGEYLKIKVVPSELAPSEKGEMVVTYAPKIRADLGFLNDQLVLFTDELENSNKSLNVIATILEYFPPMTEAELAKAPHITFDEEEFDFDRVNEGDSLVHSFVFKNIGGSPLNIRKIKSSCDCTISELDKNDIAAGESSTIKVIFNTLQRRGPQVKRITLFTNDPTAPAKDLVIKAYVKEAGN